MSSGSSKCFQCIFRSHVHSFNQVLANHVSCPVTSMSAMDSDKVFLASTFIDTASKVVHNVNKLINLTSRRNRSHAFHEDLVILNLLVYHFFRIIVSRGLRQVNHETQVRNFIEEFIKIKPFLLRQTLIERWLEGNLETDESVNQGFAQFRVTKPFRYSSVTHVFGYDWWQGWVNFINS